MTRAPSPLQFSVRAVPPFRLDLTVWALRRRPRNLVDRWDGVTYRRVVVLNGRAMEVAFRTLDPSPVIDLLASPNRDRQGVLARCERARPARVVRA